MRRGVALTARSVFGCCGRRNQTAPVATPFVLDGGTGSRRGHGDGAALQQHPRPDHLTRTACEPRHEVVAPARILWVRDETPTVKELCLEVEDPQFTFLPGNWVDFFIDGVDKVGGYSMVSTPVELPRLRLAVKRSKHPPAAWCHSEAANPGTVVQMKAGGKFDWDARRDGAGTAHLLLVAGGIGINPLFSMLQAAVAASQEEVPELRRITLLYSASRPSELAYRADIERIAAADPRVHVEFRTTQNHDPEEPPHGAVVGRLDVAALGAAIVAVDSGCGSNSNNSAASSCDGNVVARAVEVAAASPPLVYVCGPPWMTDSIVSLLHDDIGLPKERVRFEKWW